MLFVKKYGALLFLVLLGLHAFCIYADLDGERTVTKLLLVPFLLVYLSAARVSAVHPLAVGALLFAFAGDALLLFPGELYFLLGMVAFIGAHICNTTLFIKLYKAGSTENGSMAAIAMVFIAIAMAVLGAFVLCALTGKLGKMLVPVLVYMLVISVMAVTAGGTARNAFIAKAVPAFITGALLFVVSDALLALNKFAWRERTADIAVMVCYGLAQFALVRGYIATTKLDLNEAT